MKMTTCKTCGAEIAKNAKSCPKCGAKNKKPIYKKWWLYAVIVVAIVIVIATFGGDKQDAGNVSTNDKTSQVQNVEYTAYNVTDLFDILNDNAMKAEQLEGSYVEITGYLGVIDSDGKYIGVEASSSDYNYVLQDVQCFFTNDEQKAKVMEMHSGDEITVKGKITDVGEVLGYSLKIDSIN